MFGWSGVASLVLVRGVGLGSQEQAANLRVAIVRGSLQRSASCPFVHRIDDNSWSIEQHRNARYMSKFCALVERGAVCSVLVDQIDVDTQFELSLQTLRITPDCGLPQCISIFFRQVDHGRRQMNRRWRNCVLQWQLLHSSFTLQSSR